MRARWSEGGRETGRAGRGAFGSKSAGAGTASRPLSRCWPSALLALPHPPSSSLLDCDLNAAHHSPPPSPTPFSSPSPARTDHRRIQAPLVKPSRAHPSLSNPLLPPSFPHHGQPSTHQRRQDHRCAPPFLPLPALSAPASLSECVALARQQTTTTTALGTFFPTPRTRHLDQPRLAHRPVPPSQPGARTPTSAGSARQAGQSGVGGVDEEGGDERPTTGWRRALARAVGRAGEPAGGGSVRLTALAATKGGGRARSRRAGPEEPARKGHCGWAGSLPGRRARQVEGERCCRPGERRDPGRDRALIALPSRCFLSLPPPGALPADLDP